MTELDDVLALPAKWRGEADPKAARLLHPDACDALNEAADELETLLPAIKAALEGDRWRSADELPEGEMGCWTKDVITVSNLGTVCMLAYFNAPTKGVWQRPRRYVGGEEVKLWRPVPAIDAATGPDPVTAYGEVK